jgi:hypothetical protein
VVVEAWELRHFLRVEVALDVSAHGVGVYLGAHDLEVRPDPAHAPRSRAGLGDALVVLGRQLADGAEGHLPFQPPTAIVDDDVIKRWQRHDRALRSASSSTRASSCACASMASISDSGTLRGGEDALQGRDGLERRQQADAELLRSSLVSLAHLRVTA